MDSLVFRCPGCQQPFQVLAEQAGQMVRCPGCEDPVKIPAAEAPQPPAAATKESSPKSDAETKTEEVQAYGCPKCEKPFGVYPSMFGSAMACPHCQQTILVQPQTQQTSKSSPVVASPPAKTKPEPKAKPPVTAKQKSVPGEPVQPRVSPADVQNGDSESVEPPPSSSVASAGVETTVAPTNEANLTKQTEQSDEPAETPVVVFVPQPVDHLLPPKFSTVDPAFFYRRHQDGSQVLLPSEDGSLKVVDNRIVRIEHDGQVYELISSPKYDRMQRMIVTNVLAVIICGLLIAIVMTLLNG